ncbi:hypothetical protein GWI33_001339 [Rhynchophorus ferrugineus]|uniref:Uncharacterized protein n=1 Tax=Rhynchophorus ferrugineus TaxID=354439 RepID=A0A834MGX8_RHYFE|nr:hypothetical protein GWI33_001339 [Rhynchophorus ferrugineus]
MSSKDESSRLSRLINETYEYDGSDSNFCPTPLISGVCIFIWSGIEEYFRRHHCRRDRVALSVCPSAVSAFRPRQPNPQTGIKDFRPGKSPRGVVGTSTFCHCHRAQLHPE